ncbi:MAG: membrane protein insertion efficiency factor YidD [Candidatus Komeilibacteria bacterium]
MKKLLLLLLGFYQKYLSPDSGLFRRPRLSGTCRFYPTCSEYTKRAIEKYGAWQGLCKGSKRLMRCHPWSKGGHDPLV